MQQGIGEVADLRLLVPGVELREEFGQFYAGHQRLVRWEFGPSPQGNAVPVVLYFDDHESGVFHENESIREEGIYVFSNSGNRWIITRGKESS